MAGSSRTAILPDVPTIAEAGPLPGYAVDVWLGVMTPAGAPRPIVDRLNSEINRITGKALPNVELDQAYTSLDITYDPLTGTLNESANRAYALGFLGQQKPDISGITYLGPLNQVLASKGLATIAQP